MFAFSLLLESILKKRRNNVEFLTYIDTIYILIVDISFAPLSYDIRVRND